MLSLSLALDRYSICFLVLQNTLYSVYIYHRQKHSWPATGTLGSMRLKAKAEREDNKA